MLSYLTRTKRHGVLWNVTDHGVQLARLRQLDQRPLTVDNLAEVPAGDDEAIGEWVRRVFPDRGRGYLPGYCGIHPIERVLYRETINTRRLVEPNYLQTLLADGAKVSGLHDWHISALHPVEGEQFTVNTPSRPGLLLGLPYSVVRETQARLRRLGIRPRRLELGSITLLGALARYVRETAYPHAVVVCEVGLGQTRIYFLARDGIHTPATLPHGLLSVMESAMKELGAPGIGAARQQLFEPTEELRGHGRRLVRMLTRHLKPAIDYFEMQTGQPIGALYCAHLPAKLGWLEETMCAAVDLEFLVPDVAAWLTSVGLQLGEDVPVPDRNWLQPLSLVGQLAPAGGANA